jgi:hypothetical protein
MKSLATDLKVLFLMGSVTARVNMCGQMDVTMMGSIKTICGMATVS